jgi:hypothetical protein
MSIYCSGSQYCSRRVLFTSSIVHVEYLYKQVGDYDVTIYDVYKLEA